MNKILKYTIIFIAVAAIGYGVFFLTNKKMFYAKIIAKAHGSYWRDYMGMDEGFLKEWSAAIKKNGKKFTYNGLNYDPETGKIFK
jgi:hypothetical protein